MNKFISALLLSTLLAGAAATAAHAEVPGEDEGLNAVMAQIDKEHAAKAAQTEQAPLVGRAGLPVATRDLSPMPTHSGC